MNNNRILIVDDSLIVLRTLEHKLAEAGYKPATAADGSEALEKTAQLRPDLIIVDVNLPPDVNQGGVAWDGFRLIEWLRHTGSAGAAPAVIITSDDLESHRDRAVGAGAVAMFQKPIDMEELMETIREQLQQTSQPA